MADKPGRWPKYRSEESERRGGHREGCNLPITCRSFSRTGGEPFLATLCDISTSGIGILVDKRVPIQTLTVVLRDLQGSFALSKLVRVKHTHWEGAAPWRLGAAFVKQLNTYELDWVLGKE